MSHFYLIILVVVLCPLTPVSSQNIAINPDRLQLMKDALSWLTLRREGKLATADDVEKYLLQHIQNRYTSSKFYRSFVIAFQQGVLPKLTLNEGDTCDPSYVWKFKHPSNNMVYWHGMKTFTFESYSKRSDASIQYCDYRQGLMCNPTTSKCECREGTKMVPITVGSSIQRCLLEQDQVCALPDFDQGGGPEGYKKRELTELVFNLEKPEGCQDGLQCRLTNTYDTVSKCYSTSNGDWVLPSGNLGVTDMRFGGECSLGVITEQGSCPANQNEVGDAPGFVCYDFGPDKSLPKGSVSRIGYCAHELGSWQVRYLMAQRPQPRSRLWNYNFIMGFVHRRSVPMSDTELKAYYNRYINEVHKKMFPGNDADDPKKGQLRRNVGDACNVAKTDKLMDIWKYFAGLEEDPLPTEAFVGSATTHQLDDKLQEMIDLANLNDGKMCLVYWSYFVKPSTDSQTFQDSKAHPPMKCVKTGTPNGDNDGACQVVSDDSTKPFAEKVQMLSDFVWKAKDAEENEERDVDQSILEANPEAQCNPRRKRSLATLEGGGCPADSECLPNYEDKLGIYDGNCELKSGVQIRNDCMDTKSTGSLGRCEEEMLKKNIMQQVNTLAIEAKLGIDEGCRFQWEQNLRKIVTSGQPTGNRYKLLVELQVEAGSGNMCDQKRLLECSSANTCQCIDSTETRVLRDEHGNVLFRSDYCYMNSGRCNSLDSVLKNLPLTKMEEEAIWKHYGEADSNCMNGNNCLFVDQEKKVCTGSSTGFTGHDLKPKKTKPGTPATSVGGIVHLPPAKPFGGSGSIWALWKNRGFMECCVITLGSMMNAMVSLV